MKRLRRFNEAKEEIDYEYIYHCFAELIDDGRAEIELIKGESVSYPYVTIRLRTKPKIDSRITSKSQVIEKSVLYDYINNHNTNNEILKDLEVSLNRLRDEYPGYKLQFNNYDTSLFIEIFKDTKEEKYPF